MDHKSYLAALERELHGYEVREAAAREAGDEEFADVMVEHQAATVAELKRASKAGPAAGEDAGEPEDGDLGGLSKRALLALAATEAIDLTELGSRPSKAAVLEAIEAKRAGS